MKHLYIGHYSEIGLKGKNRHLFERKLVSNLKRAFEQQSPEVDVNIRLYKKRIFIEVEGTEQSNKIESLLRRVFGIVNVSRAVRVQSKPNVIIDACLDVLKPLAFQTFAIRTKRSDKRFPKTSYEMNVKVGAAVAEQLRKTVDLTSPDINCYIEIVDDYSYIYIEKLAGAMGMPVGSHARSLVLLSGGFDSPVAAYFILKRGSACHFIHFHSEPYTNKASQEKVFDLAKTLNIYQFESKLYMVPFADIQQEIVLNSPDRFRVILYRRFMMRISEALAHRKRIKALVTGESLGQVASQTLENMGVVGAVTKLPVLRPLLGMDKSEIIDVARHIDTYDISRRPHDDACTRFMPRKPEIKARLRDVEEAEALLDIEALVKRGFEQIEVLSV